MAEATLEPGKLAKEAEELEAEFTRNGDQLFEELAKHYDRSESEIERAISAFYAQYETDEGLSLQEAEMPLRRAEINAYNERISEYESQITEEEVDTIPMENPATRIEALFGEIDAITIIATIAVTSGITRHLRGSLEDSYLRIAFMIQGGVETYSRIPSVSPETVSETLAFPWSGETYDDRVRANRESFWLGLKRTIREKIVRNEMLKDTIAVLRKKVKAWKTSTQRIIRTESNRIFNEGTALAYRLLGVERYSVLATIDARTSQVCRRENGKTYLLEERITGVNYPPFHPNCRTIVLPVTSNLTFSGRFISSISFSSWKNRFVQ